MIPVLLNYTTKSEQTHSRRVVAQDFIGCGRSDKRRQDVAYNFDLHRDAMVDFIESLNLTNITLIVQDCGGLLAPSEVVPGKDEQSWTGSHTHPPRPTPDVADLMDKLGHHLSEDERRAYRARFPDDTYKGGVRRFPRMIMIEEDMPDVGISKKSRHSLETTGTLVKDAVFVACGMQDPILGPHMKSLARVFRNGCHCAEIEDALHFVQVKSRSWRLRS
ncbi:hypothetical protein LTR91_024544 [Friedmanniomyces endolithicus]|uniref:AB hydrolase-1 domain-containing protein n=1 Tax=Friedmanniomyces endolithicus TaxID=329885 RepID=A0AAN6JXC8_9PEZI|nr:hypothetical protein LTR91_024544 [Friedmanniomyces endolithicus]